MNPPILDFGGSGAPLYFLHANGYPPNCYRPLLMLLAKHHHVSAMVQRPLWPDSQPEDISDWTPLTDDLLKSLDAQQAGPVVCIGHSMGAIALLRAALRAPKRFSAIVLIDPVIFPPRVIRTWQVLRLLGLSKRLHPLIAATRERRSQFNDLDRLFTGYRRKPVFKYMDDEALRAYVEGIACPAERGYQLCYSADWEMRIYETGMWRDMDIWRGLPGLQPPTLILRGAETDTFWAATGRLVQRKQPKVRVETVAKSTHLLPLERPREVSKIILPFLEETL
ncbi:MAG: alpha/beta hydrolase [Chloroflexi bacterium]|nr:alpha/beta hydrolase [Chloroflexota bacterium]